MREGAGVYDPPLNIVAHLPVPIPGSLVLQPTHSRMRAVTKCKNNLAYAPSFQEKYNDSFHRR